MLAVVLQHLLGKTMEPWALSPAWVEVLLQMKSPRCYYQRSVMQASLTHSSSSPVDTPMKSQQPLYVVQKREHNWAQSQQRNKRQSYSPFANQPERNLGLLKTRTAPQTPISHSLVLTEVPYMKDVKECWGTNEVMRDADRWKNRFRVTF